MWKSKSMSAVLVPNRLLLNDIFTSKQLTYQLFRWGKLYEYQRRMSMQIVIIQLNCIGLRGQRLLFTQEHVAVIPLVDVAEFSIGGELCHELKGRPVY